MTTMNPEYLNYLSMNFDPAPVMQAVNSVGGPVASGYNSWDPSTYSGGADYQAGGKYAHLLGQNVSGFTPQTAAGSIDPRMADMAKSMMQPPLQMPGIPGGGSGRGVGPSVTTSSNIGAGVSQALRAPSLAQILGKG